MKHIRLYLVTCCILTLFFSGVILAQDKCEVLVPELVGSYTGKCKKGLAHGNGKAVGVDSYEGRFSKGFPNGSGKYTWADGRIFEGEWSKGELHGKGTMTYPEELGDSVVTGFWKAGKYVGKELIPPYRIVAKRGVTRYSVNKLNEIDNGVRVGLFQAGNYNSDVQGFSMVCVTGTQHQSGRHFILEDAIPPYTVSIKYRTWNLGKTVQSDVFFEVSINEPGMFEISITNN